MLLLTTLRRLIIQSFCREHLKVGQKLGIFRYEIFKSKIQSFSCLRTERTEKFMTTAQQEGNSNGPRTASFIWVDERPGGYYFATEGYFCIIWALCCFLWIYFAIIVCWMLRCCPQTRIHLPVSSSLFPSHRNHGISNNCFQNLQKIWLENFTLAKFFACSKS